MTLQVPGRRGHDRAHAPSAEGDAPFDPPVGGPIDEAMPGRSEPRRGWVARYLTRVVAADVAAAAAVSAVSFALLPRSLDEGPLVLLTPLLALLWPLALFVANAYTRRFLGITPEEYRSVVAAAIGMIALASVIAFVFKWEPGRISVVSAVAALFVAGLLSRAWARRWLDRGRHAGRLMQRTVVVGHADSAGDLLRSILAEPGQGLMPVAVCASGLGRGDHGLPATVDGVPVLGSPDDALAAVDLCDAEVVAIASHPDLSGKALRRFAWALEERGVELIVAPGLLDVAGPRLSIRPSTNLSLLHVERPGGARRAVLLKACCDRVLALLALMLLAPVMSVIAAAITLTDRGPALFRQERVGVGGAPFRIYKFRTMCVDAEARLAALQALSDGNQVLFKMQRDPRVTRVGQVLRRFSLDELPQLFNVLRGEMSLIGPRPPLASEVEQYERDALRRLHVKPGMTGLWQVSGRSDLSWEESLKLDLHYVDNWTLTGDVQILARTVRAVFGGSGAY